MKKNEQKHMARMVIEKHRDVVHAIPDSVVEPFARGIAEHLSIPFRIVYNKILKSRENGEKQ